MRRRSSVVCVRGDELLVVALEDPATHVTELYLPGGAIEPGESPAEAAVRETREETGYAVVLDARAPRILRYPFLWGGQVYDCETHFFAARLAEAKARPAVVRDAAYHRGASWLPVADVSRRFAYHQGILAEIRELLR